MKKNIKRIISVAAVITIIAVLGLGAFSYFTDYVSQSFEARAGTLDISMSDATDDLTNGLGILNPGDSNDLTFTVNNDGEKSADVKAVITITANQAMTTADTEYKLTDNDGNELTGGVLSADGLSVTYTIDDVILNGSIETEDGITATSEIYDYQLVMDPDAKNAWMESTVTVEIEVYAKQHRNTSELGSDWISIVEDAPEYTG